MMQTQPFEKHVWAEIDLEALRHNFRAVTALCSAPAFLRKRVPPGWP